MDAQCSHGSQRFAQATSPIHDDVIKWKHFSSYWPFVRGIHRSPVNSPHKGQWHGALMFSLICARINGGVNSREAGDLRRHQAHHDVIVNGVSYCCLQKTPPVRTMSTGSRSLLTWSGSCGWTRTRSLTKRGRKQRNSGNRKWQTLRPRRYGAFSISRGHFSPRTSRKSWGGDVESLTRDIYYTYIYISLAIEIPGLTYGRNFTIHRGCAGYNIMLYCVAIAEATASMFRYYFTNCSRVVCLVWV